MQSGEIGGSGYPEISSTNGYLQNAARKSPGREPCFECLTLLAAVDQRGGLWRRRHGPVDLAAFVVVLAAVSVEAASTPCSDMCRAMPRIIAALCSFQTTYSWGQVVAYVLANVHVVASLNLRGRPGFAQERERAAREPIGSSAQHFPSHWPRPRRRPSENSSEPPMSGIRSSYHVLPDSIYRTPPYSSIALRAQHGPTRVWAWAGIQSSPRV
jgi:hypothetical protein